MRSPSTSRRAPLALAALAALGASSTAVAERVGATRVHHLATGLPLAPGAMARVDPARTAVARDPFPRSPRILWRSRGATSLERAPAVDADGSVVIAGVGALARLSARGELLWTLPMPASSSATTPVIATDAALWVVTNDGDLLVVERGGVPRFRHSLGSAASKVEPLPLRDGAVAVALGREVAVFDRRGDVTARSSLSSPARTLASDADALFVLTRSSQLVRLRPPASASTVGSFGGNVTSDVALRDGLAHAIVDHSRWVTLDVRTGQRATRATLPATVSAAGLAILDGGATRIVTASGLVFGLDAGGTEQFRTGVAPAVASPPSTAAGDDGPGTPILADSTGAVVHARAGLDLTIVSSSGEAHSAGGASCADALAIVPAGPRRLVLACRSGLVLAIGE